MTNVADAVAAERFRVALDLFDAGVELMRGNLRRAHPDETDEQISSRLGAWLRERPGAELGDCPGRLVDWPPRPG